MKPISRPSRAARSWALRVVLLASSAIAGTALAQEAPTPTPAPATDSQRLNATGRTVSLTVPAKDGAYYLGDIVLSIAPDDRIAFDAERTFALLASVMDARALEAVKSALSGRPRLAPADFAGTGLTARYDAQRLELVFSIPPELKAAQRIAVTALDRERLGAFEKPAGFSAYLNARATLDYVHVGANEGLDDPIFLLDGAARWNGVALESEAIAEPGNGARDFQAWALG